MSPGGSSAPSPPEPCPDESPSPPEPWPDESPSESPPEPGPEESLSESSPEPGPDESSSTVVPDPVPDECVRSTRRRPRPPRAGAGTAEPDTGRGRRSARSGQVRIRVGEARRVRHLSHGRGHGRVAEPVAQLAVAGEQHLVERDGPAGDHGRRSRARRRRGPRGRSGRGRPPRRVGQARSCGGPRPPGLGRCGCAGRRRAAAGPGGRRRRSWRTRPARELDRARSARPRSAGVARLPGWLGRPSRMATPRSDVSVSLLPVCHGAQSRPVHLAVACVHNRTPVGTRGTSTDV